MNADASIRIVMSGLCIYYMASVLHLREDYQGTVSVFAQASAV